MKPNRFLHAESGGTHPALRIMLPIRQKLSTLKRLPAGPKAVLIEVCGLYENGGKESCWITNPALAERIGSHPVTVSRNLLWLFETGLLDVRHRPDLGNRRELVPTAATRSVYTGEQLPDAVQELLDKRHGSKQNAKSTPLSETLRPSYQNAKTLLAKQQDPLSNTLTGYQQNAKSCLQGTTSKLSTTDTTAAPAAPQLENDRIVFEPEGLHNSELAPEDSTAWASHTRGAAPANIDADDMPPRSVAIDESQPDDEFHRWVARPRDAQMVDDYLARMNHPKAGKGALFFDWYESLGWMIGKNRMPCMNWKALLKSFKFFEPTAHGNSSRPGYAGNRPSAADRLHTPAATDGFGYDV